MLFKYFINREREERITKPISYRHVRKARVVSHVSCEIAFNKSIRLSLFLSLHIHLRGILFLHRYYDSCLTLAGSRSSGFPNRVHFNLISSCYCERCWENVLFSFFVMSPFFISLYATEERKRERGEKKICTCSQNCKNSHGKIFFLYQNQVSL